MSKWSVSLEPTVYIGYDDIEADSREEAEQIAKDRALEDIDYNNCDADDKATVYSCYETDDICKIEGED